MPRSTKKVMTFSVSNKSSKPAPIKRESIFDKINPKKIGEGKLMSEGRWGAKRDRGRGVVAATGSGTTDHPDGADGQLQRRDTTGRHGIRRGVASAFGRRGSRK